MKKADREAELVFIRLVPFVVLWFHRKGRQMFRGAINCRSLWRVRGQEYLHPTSSDLTGASLDKPGSIHPLKRVGIIQLGCGKPRLDLPPEEDVNANI